MGLYSVESRMAVLPGIAVEGTAGMVTQLSGAYRTRQREVEPRTETQILSVVCVASSGDSRFLNVLAEVHREMETLAVPAELVVVLNGDSRDSTSALRLLADRCRCMQIYVLRRRVDYVTALLAGIENAIGDWVATIDAEVDDPAVIPRLRELACRENAEVVFGVAGNENEPLFSALFSKLFHWCFRTLNGFDLCSESSSVRLLSRATVNSLLNDKSPLVAFETLSGRGGYRQCLIPTIKRGAIPRPVGERVARRWRTLIGVNAAPLRLANLLSGFGAVCALSYSFYVLVVYLIKKDVIPGWTTLSFMMSGMFLSLTVVLWLLSEYMLIALDPTARRPHYEISDEFGGRPRSTGDDLNVETEL